MILYGIFPGPKEQDPEQIQCFLRIFVNELIRLWRHGFVVSTSKHPHGILVRVILVCVICDKPAAHKVGGFGSHSHTFFCTRCWIQQSNKASAAAFQSHGMGVPQVSAIYADLCSLQLSHPVLMPCTQDCHMSMLP